MTSIAAVTIITIITESSPSFSLQPRSDCQIPISFLPTRRLEDSIRWNYIINLNIGMVEDPEHKQWP